MEEAKKQKTPESKQPKPHRLVTQIPKNKIPEFPSPKPIRHHRPPSGPQPHTLSPATRGREKDVSDTIIEPRDVNKKCDSSSDVRFGGEIQATGAIRQVHSVLGLVFCFGG